VAYQQHNTLPGGRVESTIGKLHLKGRFVIDLGLGGGALALLALEAGAEWVLGVEVDPTLRVPHGLPIVTVRADLNEDVYLPPGACVVSAPPYDIFPRCLDLMGKYTDVWTLCPPRHLDLALQRGLRLVATETGGMFDPPSKGLHHILVRGDFAKDLP